MIASWHYLSSFQKTLCFLHCKVWDSNGFTQTFFNKLLHCLWNNIFRKAISENSVAWPKPWLIFRVKCESIQATKTFFNSYLPSLGYTVRWVTKSTLCYGPWEKGLFFKRIWNVDLLARKKKIHIACESASLSKSLFKPSWAEYCLID